MKKTPSTPSQPTALFLMSLLLMSLVQASPLFGATDNYRGDGPRENDIMQCTIADPTMPIKLMDFLPTAMGVPKLSVKSVEIVRRGDASVVTSHDSIPSGTKLYPVIFRVKFDMEDKMRAEAPDGGKNLSNDEIKALKQVAFMHDAYGMPFEGYFFRDSYGGWRYASYAQFGSGDASRAYLEEVNKMNAKVAELVAKAAQDAEADKKQKLPQRRREIAEQEKAFVPIEGAFGLKLGTKLSDYNKLKTKKINFPYGASGWLRPEIIKMTSRMHSQSADRRKDFDDYYVAVNEFDISRMPVPVYEVVPPNPVKPFDTYYVFLTDDGIIFRIIASSTLRIGSWTLSEKRRTDKYEEAIQMPALISKGLNKYGNHVTFGSGSSETGNQEIVKTASEDAAASGDMKNKLMELMESYGEFYPYTRNGVSSVPSRVVYFNMTSQGLVIQYCDESLQKQVLEREEARAKGALDQKNDAKAKEREKQTKTFLGDL